MQINDALSICLDLRAGVNRARRQLYFLPQIFIANGIVTFKCHPIDDGIFLDQYGDASTILANGHISEQACRKQTLEGFIDLSR